MTQATAMSAPTDAQKELKLYHGTDEAHAHAILASGYLQGRIVQGRAQQAPVAGYIYTTKDVTYAVGYAGAWSYWGSGCRTARQDGTENFTSYVFVVDVSKSEDILVDEDTLGEMGTQNRPNRPLQLPEELHSYLKRIARSVATDRQLEYAEQGYSAYQSAIGKKMQKAIPKDMMQKLIDHLPHLALSNPEKRIPIIGYYTLDRVVSSEEEFFKYAKYHEYRAPNHQAVASFLSSLNVPHLVVAADDSVAIESVKAQIPGILRDLGYPGLPIPKIEVKHRYDSDYLAQCIYTPDTDKNNTTILFMRNVTETPELLRRILVHELCHHIDFMVYWAPLANQDKLQYNREMRRKDRLGDLADHGGHGKFWQMLAAKANHLYGEGYVQKFSDKAAREQQADIPAYYILLKNDLITKRMSMARASKPSAVQKLYLQKLEQADPDHEIYKLVKSTNPTLAGCSALIGKGFVSFREQDLTDMLKAMWETAEPVSIEAPDVSKNAGFYVLVYREERRDGRVIFRWAQSSRPSPAQKAYIARAITSEHNPPKLYKVASANLARGVAIGKGQGYMPDSAPNAAAVNEELKSLWESGTELGQGLT